VVSDVELTSQGWHVLRRSQRPVIGGLSNNMCCNGCGCMSRPRNPWRRLRGPM
jgi:hypothetical protein